MILRLTDHGSGELVLVDSTLIGSAIQLSAYQDDLLGVEGSARTRIDMRGGETFLVRERLEEFAASICAEDE